MVTETLEIGMWQDTAECVSGTWCFTFTSSLITCILVLTLLFQHTSVCKGLIVFFVLLVSTEVPIPTSPNLVTNPDKVHVCSVMCGDNDLPFTRVYCIHFNGKGMSCVLWSVIWFTCRLHVSISRDICHRQDVFHVQAAECDYEKWWMILGVYPWWQHLFEQASWLISDT